MGGIDSISSVKDLRCVSFSDLFYEVTESDAGVELARSIAARIDGAYSSNKSKSIRRSRRELVELRDALIKGRKEHDERVKVAQLGRSGRKVWHLEREYLIQDASGNSWQNVLFTSAAGMPANVSNPKVKSKKLVHDALKSRGKESSEIVHWICSNNYVYDEAMMVIDERLNKTASEAKRYLDALLLLPKLDDDQDMIVFFGNNFHVTFAGIDAYTGLLFAYEYFEDAGLA